MCGQRTADEIWLSAPEVPGGRAFMVWLMPVSDYSAADALVQTFGALADGIIACDRRRAHAGSHRSAEAWRAPPLVRDADARHGNQVVSLVVLGHDWNNRLRPSPLYCRVGIAQAVARDGSREVVDPQDFIRYLDAIMAANPGTRVWNLSLNQRQSCDPDFVSYLAVVRDAMHPSSSSR